MISLENIRKVSFRKSNIGGYRTEEVESFIEDVAELCETLQKERQIAAKREEQLQQQLQQYKEREYSVGQALLTAQTQADALLQKAKTDAEALLSQAQAKVDAITQQAQQQADTLTAEAGARAEALTAEANQKAEAATVLANSLVEKQVTEANAAAEACMAEAQKRSETMIAETQQHIQTAVQEVNERVAQEKALYRALKQEATDFREQLLQLYRQHLVLIQEIPAIEEEPETDGLIQTPTIAPVAPIVTDFIPEIAEESAEVPAEPEQPEEPTEAASASEPIAEAAVAEAAVEEAAEAPDTEEIQPDLSELGFESPFVTKPEEAAPATEEAESEAPVQEIFSNSDGHKPEAPKQEPEAKEKPERRVITAQPTLFDDDIDDEVFRPENTRFSSLEFGKDFNLKDNAKESGGLFRRKR